MTLFPHLSAMKWWDQMPTTLDNANKRLWFYRYCLRWGETGHEKCWTGWNISWNQDCREKYQSPQICRWHHPYGRKWRWAKKPLDESQRGEWKSWLKAQHSENKGHGIWSHHFMRNRRGNSGNSIRFLGAPKSLQMVTAAVKLKDAYSLEGKLWPT